MAQLKLTLRLRELLRLVLCMRGALGFALGPALLRLKVKVKRSRLRPSFNCNGTKVGTARGRQAGRVD